MPEPRSPFVALTLRRARREAGLSQRSLAKLAKVPASTVGAAESGARDLPVQVLDALLAACGWTLGVVDGAGELIVSVPEGDDPRDAVGRRYPAHVDLRTTERPGSWWGDRWGPYWGRPRRPRWTFDLPRRPCPDPVPDETDGPRRVLRVAAYGVVVDERARILLTRLSPVTDHPGWWTLPGGGIEHGEHPRDAVVREVLEETGLAVDVHELLDLRSFRRAPGEDGRLHDCHALQVLYRATARDSSSALVVEVEGTTDDARWVPLADVEELPLVDLSRAGVELAQASEAQRR
jgi:ADP-ribose pyrophosphatase YjhB (NUDIX family)/transcriptional regulator with XRE-family HTH domain